jgi:hypothetical protein
MWEASWGIITILGLILFIGYLSSGTHAKPQTRSRPEVKMAEGTGATGATATIINAKADSDTPDVALQQAAQGVTPERPEKEQPTPAERSSVGIGQRKASRGI